MRYKGSTVYDDPAFSKRYAEKRHRTDNPNDTIEKPVILDLLGTVSNKTILDLGCGDGRFGKELLNAGAVYYLGVDGSERMFEAAKKELEAYVAKVERSSLETWSFPTEAFDLIISRLVFHYIENLNMLFLSIFQSLKPGGSFVFSVEHPIITSSYESYNNVKGKRGNWIVDQYFESGERLNVWEGKEVVKYHKSLEEYFRICKNAGFLIDEIRESKPERRYFQKESVYERRKRIPLFLFFKLVKRLTANG